MLPRVLILLIALALPVAAQEADDPHVPMTLDRLGTIIEALDPDALTDGRVWQFEIAGTALLVITDAFGRPDAGLCTGA